MKYLALIYADPKNEPQYGTPEFDAMLAGYGSFTKAVQDAGVYIAGEALQETDTATSVRVRGGKTETTDGPFAETKERLGGYYLLDCKDLDEALRYAAMIPSAEHGTVEVRPIMDYNV